MGKTWAGRGQAVSRVSPRRHQSLKQSWRGNDLHSRDTTRPKDMIPIMERKSILIVDDDPAILNSFKEILEPEGYNVDTAQTGSEALENGKARLYNIAVIVINLLDTAGTEIHPKVPGITPKAR